MSIWDGHLVSFTLWSHGKQVKRCHPGHILVPRGKSAVITINRLCFRTTVISMPLLVHEAEVSPSSNNKATLLDPSKEPKLGFLIFTTQPSFFLSFFFYLYYTYNQLVSPHDCLRLVGGPWAVWEHSNCVHFKVKLIHRVH